MTNADPLLYKKATESHLTHLVGRFTMLKYTYT